MQSKNEINLLHCQIANSLLLRQSKDIYILNDVIIGDLTPELRENLKTVGISLIEEKAYLCG